MSDGGGSSVPAIETECYRGNIPEYLKDRQISSSSYVFYYYFFLSSVLGYFPSACMSMHQETAWPDGKRKNIYIKKMLSLMILLSWEEVAEWSLWICTGFCRHTEVSGNEPAGFVTPLPPTHKAHCYEDHKKRRIDVDTHKHNSKFK